MEKTYNMLTTIIIQETEQMTLEEIASEYQGNLSPSLLAIAFKKLYKLIIYTGNKYTGLTSADIASFSLEKLDYCLSSYTQGEVKFITYFTTVLKNKFREETQSLNTHKRKAMFVSNSYEQMVENGYDVAEEMLDLDNLSDDLKSYGLSDREILYCEYLVQDLPNKEIAEILGVSQMTLSNMRKKLRQKLMPLALNFA